MGVEDEITRIHQAVEAKLPTNLVCPVCTKGQMDLLDAGFVVKPRLAPGVEPIDAAGRVCVYCGFLAMHSVKYLLAESL
jgi:hypothetical protein